MIRRGPRFVLAGAVGLLSVAAGSAATWSAATCSGAAGRPAGTAGPAADPSPSAAVRVQLDAVQPLVLTPGDPVTVRGTVVNHTAHPLVGLTAELVVGTGYFPNRMQLHAARGAPGMLPVRTVPATSHPVDDPRLARDATSAFVVTAPHGADLQLADPQVGAVGVIVRSAAGVELGRATVAEPYFTAPIRSPIRVSLVLPVTAQPSWLPAGLPAGTAPASDALVGELTPGGRLGQLLAAIERRVPAAGPTALSLTLAVDPALLERVDELAGAAAGATGGAQAARQTATEWLTELKTVAGRPGVTISALPYADADLAALARDNDARGDGVRLLRDAPGRLRPLLGGAVQVSLNPVVTADLRLAPEAVDLVADAGATLAVVSDAQLRPAGLTPDGALASNIPPTQTDVAQHDPGTGALVGLGGGRLPALATDGTLQRLLADPAPAPVIAAQDLLAELAMITSEAPNKETRRGAVLVAPRRWDPPAAELDALLQGLATAPWLTSRSVGDNLASTVPSLAFADRVPQVLRPPDPQADGALADTAALRGQVAALHALSADPAHETLSPPLSLALDRSLSTFWRTVGAPGGAALRGAVRQQTAGYLGQVQVAISKHRLLTGPSGAVPVQLSNDLPEAVRLRLHLAGGPAGVVTAPDLVVTLARPQAGTAAVKQQQQLQVTARRLGTHRTALQVLSDTDDRLVVKPDYPVEIRSTAYGVVAVGITAGALTVLVLAFVVRGVRWSRRRSLARRP